MDPLGFLLQTVRAPAPVRVKLRREAYDSVTLPPTSSKLKPRRPSPSVRGFFLQEKPRRLGSARRGPFRWAAPAGAIGIGAEHLAALCHASTQGQASLATGGRSHG